VAVFAQLHRIGLTAQSSSSSPGASP
jgi:hypothetical protein